MTHITKTYLYNYDPIKPHFYIVKLGFTGVYIIFLISALKHCGYSLEPPRRGGSNDYPQAMFWAEIWKISEFLSEIFQFFGGEIFNIFEYASFRNEKDERKVIHWAMLTSTAYHIYFKYSGRYLWRAVKTQIKRCRTRCLIRVFSVCHSPSRFKYINIKHPWIRGGAYLCGFTKLHENSRSNLLTTDKTMS